MRQKTGPHVCTIGRPLGVVLTVALGLALGSQAVEARECHREAPLPADVHLIAPGSEVPEAVARFAGIWSGEAVDERGSICHTLVVEEVLANGYARVIVSMGTSAALHVRLPWFLRATGRVVDGEVRVQLPLLPPRLAYRLAGETLQGTHEGGDWRPGRTTLTPVADESQVGCGPPAAGPMPPLSAPGARDRLTAAELLAPDAGHRPAFVRRGLRHVILGPVHNAYFMPIGQAAPAPHAFQGTVTVAFSTCSERGMDVPAWARPCPASRSPSSHRVSISCPWCGTSCSHRAPTCMVPLSSPQAGCGRSPAMGACPAPPFPLC